LPASERRCGAGTALLCWLACLAPAIAGGVGIRVEVGALELGATRIEDLRGRCRLRRAEDGAVRCADLALAARLPGGAVGARGALRIDPGSGRILPETLRLEGAGGRLSLATEPGAAAVRFEARDLDFARLWPLLAPYAGAGYSEAAGKLGAEGRLTLGRRRALTAALEVEGLELLGRNVAEGLAGSLRVSVAERPGGADFSLELALSGGLAYIEPGLRRGGLRPGFAFELDRAPLELAARGTYERSPARLEVDASVSHATVARASVSVAAALGGEGALESLALDLHEAAAAPLYRHYLQPLALGTALDDAELAGRLAGRLRLDGAGVRAARLQLEDLHVYDKRERFHLAGLDGTLRFTAGDAPLRSRIRWQGAGVYRLDFGAAEVEMLSRAGRIESLHWSDIGFLDGRIRIERLAAGYGAGEFHLELSGELTPVSLLDLTQQLQWPLMAGTLAGRLDGLSYGRGRAAVEGALRVELFDGEILIHELSLADMFGTVPVLRTSFDVHDLDLEQLTGRFAFGKIEGRLDGYVRDLELHAWQPVYFEAKLETPEDDDSPHRISQRAVNNLGVLGGGTGGVLSSGLAGLFREYSYDRLGLSCRLYNGVCELGGVEADENGFYILTRGGLLPPWIEVRGIGRSIAWEDLVQGIRQIGAGEVVVE